MDGDLEIIFRQSAFRHGVTEADIRWAFNTVEFDELIHEGKRIPRFSLLGCVYKITFKTGVIDYGRRRYDRRRSSILE
jgi:hypothetical protein